MAIDVKITDNSDKFLDALETKLHYKKDKRITDVSSKEALGWTFFKLAINGERTEVDPSIDQKKATIRQVCYEVLISLYNHFPELFRETYF